MAVLPLQGQIIFFFVFLLSFCVFFLIVCIKNRNLVMLLLLLISWVNPFILSIYAISLLRARKRTKYIFSKGWLHVESGGFFAVQTFQSFELIHLIDAEISCGPLDQLTGNGVLQLVFEKQEKSVKLQGLGPISEISSLPYELMNLARLMRSSSLVRSGIIA